MEVATKQSRPGWLRVHWKLVVTVWVGLSLAGAVAAFVLMTNSDAAKIAVSTAESNALLSEKLGIPMKTGWFISGKIEVNPAGGHAELAIPVSVPEVAERFTPSHVSEPVSGNWIPLSMWTRRAASISICWHPICRRSKRRPDNKGTGGPRLA
jgi:hypothetical protein